MAGAEVVAVSDAHSVVLCSSPRTECSFSSLRSSFVYFPTTSGWRAGVLAKRVYPVRHRLLVGIGRLESGTLSRRGDEDAGGQVEQSQC